MHPPRPPIKDTHLGEGAGKVAGHLASQRGIRPKLSSQRLAFLLVATGAVLALIQEGDVCLVAPGTRRCTHASATVPDRKEEVD